MTYDPIDTGPNDSTADRNLGTSGDPIPETFTESSDVTNLRSDSLPTWRIYKDGSEVVAVDETDTEIDRDTDAHTVWQSAINQANSDFDPNETHEPVAKIDGGGLEYTLSTELIIKDGAHVESARFGASATTGVASVTVGGPDDGFGHRAITVRDVVVRDSGTDAFRLRDLGDCQLERLLAESASGNGFNIQSCIANSFEKLVGRSCGGRGAILNNIGDTSNSCNANTFTACRFNSNTSDGVEITGQARTNTFVGLVSEDNGLFGVEITSTGPSQENVFINPHLESNGNYGFDDDGDETIIVGGTYSGNDSSRGLRLTGTDTTVYGPIRGGDDLNENGTDVNLVGLNSDMFNQALGTRPRWNGVIGGGPIGGVDLGSTTGQYDGDEAVSDGTNASASAGDKGRWDAGNTQWNVFNADATI